MLIAVLLNFNICVSPYCISSLLKTFGIYCVNETLYGVFELILLYNSAFNFIIYAIFNRNFREGYKRTFALVFPKIHPSNQVGVTNKAVKASNLNSCTAA